MVGGGARRRGWRIREREGQRLAGGRRVGGMQVVLVWAGRRGGWVVEVAPTIGGGPRGSGAPDQV